MPLVGKPHISIDTEKGEGATTAHNRTLRKKTLQYAPEVISNPTETTLTFAPL